MSEIHAIFWDIGGVLLTDAWDHNERAAALEHFHLDKEEFHSRHEKIVSSFERGEITLDEYLDRTVFYDKRSFTRDEFRDYMFSLSRPMSGRAGLRARPGRFRQILHGHDQQRVARVELAPHREVRLAGNLPAVCQLLLRRPAQAGERHLSSGD